jgi:hypothetical protein
MDNLIEKIDLYLIRESKLIEVIKGLRNKSWNKVISVLKSNWKKFVNLIRENGLEKEVINIINKHLKTNYKSLNDISGVNEDVLNEDFKHFWDMVKQEAFPTLAFYPALSIWMEIDKIFRNVDMDFKKVLIYGIFWVFLMSGKHIKLWKQWKEKNKKEWEEEGMKKNPFSI